MTATAWAGDGGWMRGWGWPHPETSVSYIYAEPSTGVASGTLNYCGNCGVFYAPNVSHVCSPPVLTFTPTPQATPHKCPCCDGFGQRDVTPPISSTSQQRETCRACSGAGVLWR